MNAIRSNPCFACPYRKDVPSGIWDSAEYDKLPAYDRETPNQPMAPFACHASPEQLCNGWAICHSNQGHDRELIALRIIGIGTHDLPKSGRIKLFESGQEASDHGKRDIPKPKKGAKIMIARLLNQYSRLRKENTDG